MGRTQQTLSKFKRQAKTSKTLKRACRKETNGRRCKKFGSASFKFTSQLPQSRTNIQSFKYARKQQQQQKCPTRFKKIAGKVVFFLHLHIRTVNAVLRTLTHSIHSQKLKVASYSECFFIYKN